MNRREMEELAAFTHGALAFGHLLACVFHVKRRNWQAVGIHAAVLTYDLVSVHRHQGRAKTDEEKAEEFLESLRVAGVGGV